MTRIMLAIANATETQSICMKLKFPQLVAKLMGVQHSGEIRSLAN
jgi:hypothetical protein